MLDKQEFNQFYKLLIKNIQILKENIKDDQFDKVLNKMGFPPNYKKLLTL